MMVKIFCFLFFLWIEKTRDQSFDLWFFVFLSTDTQKNSISRSSSVFAANFTQYDDNPSKKKLIKMGGWDGGRSWNKGIEKKIFHQLISCSDLTRKHSSCETQWGPNLLWNCILNFPAIIFTRFFFPRFFIIIMNEKALIERKKSREIKGGYKELKCDFKMAMIPLCLETFFRNDI